MGFLLLAFYPHSDERENTPSMRKPLQLWLCCFTSQCEGIVAVGRLYEEMWLMELIMMYLFLSYCTHMHGVSQHGFKKSTS